MLQKELSLRPIPGMPELEPGSDVGALIVECVQKAKLKILPKDIFVVAQKIVSKAEGRIVELEKVEPSERASRWAREHRKDPRTIETILRESARVLRMERGLIISETPHGFVCANAGVDRSNLPPGEVSLLPEDPDRSAEQIRQVLEGAFGGPLGVIISDTFGRPWREGLVNVALGVAGMPALIDYRGEADRFGQPLEMTQIAVADELASAAELVMAKSEGMPVVLIQGFQYRRGGGCGRDLLRAPEKDLFR